MKIKPFFLTLALILCPLAVQAQTSTPAPTAATTKSPPKSQKSTTVTVNINQATLLQLQTVKGIGAKTAQKIIAGRPYKTPDQLVTKNVLSAKAFAKIKTQLTLN
jgi:DNA uptake protein ComE-like DNA-binding protein